MNQLNYELQKPTCILCKTNNKVIYFFKENNYQLYKCNHCKLVFVHPKPEKDEIGKLYDRESGCTFNHASAMREYFEKYLEAKKRFKIIQALLEKAKVKDILEVGCGAGYFLKYLKKCGYNIRGLELSQKYVNFAKNVLGVEAYYGDLKTLNREKGFDAAMLFDVISHIYSPVEDLRLLRSLLRTNPIEGLQHLHGLLKRVGIIVIETGNGGELTPEKVGKWGAPEHLYHFSEMSLRILLENTGFKILKVFRFDVTKQHFLLKLLNKIMKGGRKDLHNYKINVAIQPTQKQSYIKRFLKEVFSTALLFLQYNLGSITASKDRFCSLIVIDQKI